MELPHHSPETPTRAGSPRLQAAADSTRTEADVRTIRARRARLEAALIEEGASAARVAQLATDETAEKMLAYERQSVASIVNLFGGAAA